MGKWQRVTINGLRLSTRHLTLRDGSWVRVCQSCGTEKSPTAEFFRVIRKRSLPIMQTVCKECQKRTLDQLEGKRKCRVCGEEKPATRECFAVERGRLTHRCRLCAQKSWRRYTKAWAGQHPRRTWESQTWSAVKRRARRSGLSFDDAAIARILADYEEDSDCPCCGSTMGVRVFAGKKRWPSVDRLDPRAGYVAGNMKIICYRCNFLKSDGTIKEFAKIIEYIRRNK